MEVCALATAVKRDASAMPSPATNFSRRLRRFMRLTLHPQPNSPQNCVPLKWRLRQLLKRRSLLYPAGDGVANRLEGEFVSPLPAGSPRPAMFSPSADLKMSGV